MKNKSPALVKKWKRIMAVGCSHGEYIDPRAAEAVIAFSDRWKPETLIHLGDAWDFACLRTGARSNPDDPDNATEISADMDSGFSFLRALGPTHLCFGNHEDRVVQLSRHWKAATKFLACRVLGDIESFCSRNHVEVLESWGNTSWLRFGDYRFGHGVFFGGGFLKKTAAAFGRTVVAHAHHPGVMTAERDDGAQCYSVGCLRTAETAGYAKSRAATLAWGHGFVWGEYTDDKAVLWLHCQPPNIKEWRLPV
jgi:hypothetical protein